MRGAREVGLMLTLAKLQAPGPGVCDAGVGSAWYSGLSRSLHLAKLQLCHLGLPVAAAALALACPHALDCFCLLQHHQHFMQQARPKHRSAGEPLAEASALKI